MWALTFIQLGLSLSTFAWAVEIPPQLLQTPGGLFELWMSGCEETLSLHEPAFFDVCIPGRNNKTTVSMLCVCGKLCLFSRQSHWLCDLGNTVQRRYLRWTLSNVLHVENEVIIGKKKRMWQCQRKRSRPWERRQTGEEEIKLEWQERQCHLTRLKLTDGTHQRRCFYRLHAQITYHFSPTAVPQVHFHH